MGLKNRISYSRAFFLWMLSFLFTSSFIAAQQHPAQDTPDYSYGELETFVEAKLKVMSLQEESQIKMVKKINEHGLSMGKYNSILQAQRRNEDIDATEEEMKAFEASLIAINAIEFEYQEKISEEIKKAGMSPEKYEEIMIHYQQDVEIERRINRIMEDKLD